MGNRPAPRNQGKPARSRCQGKGAPPSRILKPKSATQCRTPRPFCLQVCQSRDREGAVKDRGRSPTVATLKEPCAAAPRLAFKRTSKKPFCNGGGVPLLAVRCLTNP